MLVRTEVVICVWMQTKGCMSCCRCLRNVMLLLVLDSLPDQQRRSQTDTDTSLCSGLIFSPYGSRG